MSETPAKSPPTYIERCEPYALIIIKLICATVILGGAALLFWAAVRNGNSDEGSLAGWAIAPVIWLVLSAYGNNKHIPELDRSAPDLHTSRLVMKTAAAIFALVAIFIPISITTWWIQTASTRARHRQIDLLTERGKVLFATGAATMNKLTVEREQRATLFLEYRLQCDRTSELLDQLGPLVDERGALLDQLQGLYVDPDAVQIVKLLKRGTEQDQRAISILRDEVACGKALEQAPKQEQARFVERCEDPANEKLAAVWISQRATLSQLRARGVNLPPNIAAMLK